MSIQEVLRSESKIRRKSWVNKEFHHFHELTLDELDILAYDWEFEIEPEVIETEIILEDRYGDKIRIFATDERWYLEVLNQEDIDFSFEEKDVAKLLDFLYNNIKVGKSRVIPF